MDPEYDSSSSSSVDERFDRQANDRRLRQAIAYLEHEGGDDPAALYVNRIQAINDHLLKGYRAENYDFDHKLYRRLRSMVREVQNDNSRIVQEDSEADLMGSDSDTGPAYLYRADDDLEADGASDEGETPGGADLRSGVRLDRRPLNQGVLQDKLQTERYFVYGQKHDTQPERWYKNFPAVLPFGDTIYLQEWENQRIHFDLSQGKNSKEPVTWNVPYDLVSAAFHPDEETYESGSRFKLPKLCKGTMKKSIDCLGLKETLDSFNNMGKATGSNTAPRIFLRKISVIDPSLNVRSPEPVPVEPRGDSRSAPKRRRRQ